MLLKNLYNKKIILASQSPRRKELLKGLDIEFSILPLDADESYDASKLKAGEITEYLCEVKANSFNHWTSNTILITADTIVWLGDQALEKPKNRIEAIQMLKQLSGRTHEVYSSAGIFSQHQKALVTDVTKVTFRKLEEDEIIYYVDKYQPYDKAGAYGVQEWIGYIGVKKIEGSYYTVMGFPIFDFYKALKSFK